MKVCAYNLLKLSMDIDGILHGVETCWFDESHIFFISFDQYSRKRIQLGDFINKN